MSKKRYTLYLSRPLARKFDQIAKLRNGAKSALVEEALKANLEPQQHPGVEEGLARRLNDLNKAAAAVGREVAVATETLALFVRYFLTITPPLPQSEQEPARLLGKERYEVFVTQIGKRLAGNHRLVSEVLETIAANQPDLFATAPDGRASPAVNGARTDARPEGDVPKAPRREGNGHG